MFKAQLKAFLLENRSQFGTFERFKQVYAKEVNSILVRQKLKRLGGWRSDSVAQGYIAKPSAH